MNSSTQHLHVSTFFRCFLTRTQAVFWSGAAIAVATFMCGAQTNIEMVFHSFTNSPDGDEPVSSLVLGPNNALYGTTVAGGNTSSSSGTLFTINVDGSGYKVLHNFSLSESGGEGLTAPPYQVFTVTYGSDGRLYGTTLHGTNGNGSVYGVNPDGSSYSVIHSFGTSDAAPQSLIQGRDGRLYGTSGSAIFTLDTSGSNYTVLHLFTNSPDGDVVFGKPMQAADGTIYGTTYQGGTNGSGTIYKLNPDGSGYAVLYSFGAAPDGANPYSGLAQGADGAIYGTTLRGGINGGGTVFKINPDGSGYITLHNFNLADGIGPLGGVIAGLGNVMYGVTSEQGLYAGGTLFSLSLDGSAYDVLYNFGSSGIFDASHPYGGLVQGPASAGTLALYGTTVYGGTKHLGAIYGLLVNPPLSIAPISAASNGNQSVVFWPAWALNYVLQTTTNPVSGTWTTVSNAIPVTGVQITNTSPAAFFRLIRP